MIRAKIYSIGILLCVSFFIVMAVAEKAFAEDKRIYLTTPSYARKVSGGGKSKLFRISGIPRNTSGQIRLRIKWHVQRIIPTFNKLQIKLIHGNKTLQTKNCYSYHAPGKSPKCVFNFAVSQAEATKYSGSSVEVWDLKVTNYSAFNIDRLNIEKGSDPFVGSFRSVYRTTQDACMQVRKNLALRNGALRIPRGTTRRAVIVGTTNFKGVLSLSAKWHANHILMPYVKLKIQVIRPNGTSTTPQYYYPIHSPRTNKPKFRNREFSATQSMASSSKKWQIRVTNNSDYDVVGFDIKKGAELNPLVPNFKSYYRVLCNN